MHSWVRESGLELTGDQWIVTVFSLFSDPLKRRGIPWSLAQPCNTVWLPLQYKLTSETHGEAHRMTSVLRSNFFQSLDGYHLVRTS